MTSVLVTVPNELWVHKGVVYVLLNLQKDTRYRLRMIFPSHRPLENNQHRIVNDFMKGDEDYWLNIDADNPPTKNPLDLVELDKDILGLPTPVFHWTEKDMGQRPYYWNGYEKRPDGFGEWKEKKGLQKVDAIGMGSFLIARRVFENVEMRKGAFTRKLNPDGTVDLGNDLSFCIRAAEQDFEIWMHYGYPCHHHHELDMLEVIRAFEGVS